MAKKFRDLVNKMPAARREAIAKGTNRLASEMLLNEIRQKREVTQTFVAKAMGITQPRVSKIEETSDLHISTLRDYIRALGGELEIVAHFPDGDVRIRTDNDKTAA